MYKLFMVVYLLSNLIFKVFTRTHTSTCMSFVSVFNTAFLIPIFAQSIIYLLEHNMLNSLFFFIMRQLLLVAIFLFKLLSWLLTHFSYPLVELIRTTGGTAIIKVIAKISFFFIVKFSVKLF